MFHSFIYFVTYYDVTNVSHCSLSDGLSCKLRLDLSTVLTIACYVGVNFDAVITGESSKDEKISLLHSQYSKFDSKVDNSSPELN